MKALKHNIIPFVFLLCGLMLSVLSCKKDEDEESYTYYLEGTLSLGNQPYYIKKGDSLTFTPSGITHPEGGNLGYYFWVYDANSTVMAQDTTKRADATKPYPDSSFTYTFPDSLGSFLVSGFCYAQESKYEASSTTTSEVTVDEFDTIKALDFRESPDYVLYPGSEDEKLYWVNVGGVKWLRKNFAHKDDSKCFYNSELMRPIFGGLYTYEQALNACPAGWHLPSDAEWADLANAAVPGQSYVAGKDFNGVAHTLMLEQDSPEGKFNGYERIWEFWPSVPIDNSTGMGMISTGYCNVKKSDPEFVGYPDYACFWTSDMLDDGSDRAVYRYIYAAVDALKIGAADKTSFAISVRCVLDGE